MSVYIARYRKYGRGANGVIFFLMVAWCLALGIVAFILIRNVLPLPENGRRGADIFSIVWLILMIIASIVFFIIGFVKVSGASKASKIRKEGMDGVGYVNEAHESLGIYSNTPVITRKVTFVYQLSDSDYGETTQLVGPIVYNRIINNYRDRLVPIKILDDDAVLDNDKIAKGKKANQVFEMPKESPKVNQVKKELSPEDRTYIDDLFQAYFLEDSKKKEELGLDRYQKIFCEYDARGVNYIKAIQLFEEANNERKAKDAMRALADENHKYPDMRILIHAGILWEHGKKDVLFPRERAAFKLYLYTVAQVTSFTTTQRILNLVNKYPDLIKDDAYFRMAYSAIAYLAEEKHSPSAYYFAYKHVVRYMTLMKFTESEATMKCFGVSMLILAKKYGYKLSPEEEKLIDTRVTIGDNTIDTLLKGSYVAVVKSFNEVINKDDKSKKEFKEEIYNLVASGI